MLAAVLLAQSLSWTAGTVQNVTTVDSGVFRYRESAAAQKVTAWTEYWINLSDIRCLKVQSVAGGTIVTVRGKESDTVQKLTRRSDSEDGYRQALGHMEIDFAGAASVYAKRVTDQLTDAVPALARTINTGACGV